MDREKQIDESWKEQAAQEKEAFKKTESGLYVDDFEKKKDEESASSGDSGATSEEEPRQKDESDQKEDDSGQQEMPEMNFLNYITSLGYQAMIFLGELPNPVTEKEEKNLDQAKLLIDTLVMLREKTKGNLNSQEENVLNSSVYELQMKYVELKK